MRRSVNFCILAAGQLTSYLISDGSALVFSSIAFGAGMALLVDWVTKEVVP